MSLYQTYSWALAKKSQMGAPDPRGVANTRIHLHILKTGLGSNLLTHSVTTYDPGLFSSTLNCPRRFRKSIYGNASPHARIHTLSNVAVANTLFAMRHIQRHLQPAQKP
jgi:hypothetical protein